MSKPARDERGRLLPGNTANPSGRPKRGQTMTDLLKQILSEDHETGVTRKEVVLRELVGLAESGDLAAIRYVCDRIDGKPTERIEAEVESRPIEEVRNDLLRLVERYAEN